MYGDNHDARKGAYGVETFMACSHMSYPMMCEVICLLSRNVLSMRGVAQWFSVFLSRQSVVSVVFLDRLFKIGVQEREKRVMVWNVGLGVADVVWLDDGKHNFIDLRVQWRNLVGVE